MPHDGPPPDPWFDSPEYLATLDAEAERSGHAPPARRPDAPAARQDARQGPAPARATQPQGRPAALPEDDRASAAKVRQVFRGGDILEPTAIGLPRAPVQSAEDAREVLKFAVQAGFTVVGPSVLIDWIPEGYRLAFRVVAFDTTFPVVEWKDDRGKTRTSPARTNGNFYDVSEGKDRSKLALHASALDQVSAVAGAEVEDVRVHEVERFCWNAEAVIRLRSFDGVVRRMRASKVLDYRDGAPALMKVGGWNEQTREKDLIPQSAAWIREARVHGAAKAETGARARAIRALLGIRPLTPAEASRPFVAPVLIYVPDMSDPWVRRQMFNQERGVAAMYDRGTDPRRLAYSPSVPAPTRGGTVDLVAGDDGVPDAWED